MFILVWTEKEQLPDFSMGFRDHWETYETIEGCEAAYNKLIENTVVYTASICDVVKSTDYERG